MTARNQAIQELEKSGYQLKRHGSNHDIYFNPTARKIIPLKRHGFDESDLRYIRKEIRQNQC